MRSMRVGILTSVETRHRHFVNRLRDECEVVAVAYEQIGYTPMTVGTADLTPEEASIVKHHFAERCRQERIFFGARSGFVEASNACAVRHTGPTEINTQGTLRLLEFASVDVVTVFGTNLIKPPLLALDLPDIDGFDIPQGPVPFLTLDEELDAVEPPPHVGPIKRGHVAFGTVLQFLAPDPQRQGVVLAQDAQVDEQLLEVPAVLVDAA